MLSEARARVVDWPLEDDSFAALEPGLRRMYRRGRREWRALQKNPSVEGLHEWRKRAKELWYDHELLRELWKPVMKAVGDEAHELSDRLGDDHDLAVCLQWSRDHAEPAPELVEAVERRRSDLQAEAFELGARLYADRPKVFLRRLERLYEASREPAGWRRPQLDHRSPRCAARLRLRPARRSPECVPAPTLVAAQHACDHLALLALEEDVGVGWARRLWYQAGLWSCP